MLSNMVLEKLDLIHDITKFNQLSLYHTIDITWLEKYPNKPWGYETLRINYNSILERETKEYMAAYRIEQWWYKITLSPEYAIGRKFINRKYDEVFEQLKCLYKIEIKTFFKLSIIK